MHCLWQAVFLLVVVWFTCPGIFLGLSLSYWKCGKHIEGNRLYDLFIALFGSTSFLIYEWNLLVYKGQEAWFKASGGVFLLTVVTFLISLTTHCMHMLFASFLKKLDT